MIHGYMIDSHDAKEIAARLKAAGCLKPHRGTGEANTAARAKRDRMLTQLGAGDELVVARLSQLANSTLDLQHALTLIAERKAIIRSLDEPWVAVTGPLLPILDGIAAFERDVRGARTEAGHARAVARGVKLGRKPKLTEKQEKEALRRRKRGETLAAIAAIFNVSHSTISRVTG